VRVAGGRDWIIPIDCFADAIVVPAGSRTRLEVSLLQRSEGADALRNAVRSMIERRQATVRPGEVPFKPQLRFLVRPEGLRTYYLAFPALESLQVPMTRVNIHRDEEKP
jgi:hypothetical protein